MWLTDGHAGADSGRPAADWLRCERGSGVTDEEAGPRLPGGRTELEWRQRVMARVRRRVERTLQPALVARRAAGDCSDLESIELRWRGAHLHLLTRHCGGSTTQSPAFARISPTADGLFDLAFLRTRGKWAPLARACTLKETLAYLDLPSPLWPRALLACDNRADAATP